MNTAKTIAAIVCIAEIALTMLLGIDIAIYVGALTLLGWKILNSTKFGLLNVPFVAFASFCLVLLLGPIVLKALGYGYYINLIAIYIPFVALFYLGYYGAKKYVIPSVKTSLSTRTSALDPHLFYKAGFILYIIGTIATLYYIIINASLLFGPDVNNGRISALSGNGVINYIGKLMWVGSFMQYEVHASRKHDGWVYVEIAIALVLSLFLGFRSAIVDALLVLLFMYNRHKPIPTSIVLISAIALGFVVVIYGAIRDGSFGLAPLVDKLLNELRVNSVNINNILETFPDEVPYQLGYTYLINLKMLLPGPDIDFTLWLKDVLSLSFSGGGVTPTILGEFYINWGYAGVMLGSTIFGAACAFLQKSYVSSTTAFIPSLFLGYLRSIITGGIANILILLLMYCATYYCVKYLIIWVTKQQITK